MKKHHVALILLALVGCTGLVAETITIDGSRPLAELTVELVRRYGYLVTYEEAPYDASTLRTDIRPNGVHFLYPSWIPTAFHVPERPSIQTATIPPLGPSVLDPLLNEYHGAGNPGKFKMIFEGEYAHIVPAARMMNGKAEDFQPILSARIPFPSETRLCYEAVRDLLFSIKTARDVTVVDGGFPANGLMRHQCTVVGANLTARDVLIQILDQMGTSVVPGGPKNRYSWTLMYDANGDLYFLSAILVPAITPRAIGSPARSAEQTSTPAPNTSGGRADAPAAKK